MKFSIESLYFHFSSLKIKRLGKTNTNNRIKINKSLHYFYEPYINIVSA